MCWLGAVIKVLCLSGIPSFEDYHSMYVVHLGIFHETKYNSFNDDWRKKCASANSHCQSFKHNINWVMYMKWIIYELRKWNQMKTDPRSYMQLRKDAWKEIKDFNGVWTRELAIPVRCSNQLSYEATDVGSSSIVVSHVPLKVKVFPLKSWIFFRLLYSIAYNCVQNCEDQSSFDNISCCSKVMYNIFSNNFFLWQKYIAHKFIVLSCNEMISLSTLTFLRLVMLYSGEYFLI